MFVKIQNELLSCKEINGVKLSLTDKILYSIMLNRYVFFKSELYDMQEYYADRLAVSVGTIKNSLNTLKAAGLISIRTDTEKHLGARKKNYYTVFKIEGSKDTTDWRSA